MSLLNRVLGRPGLGWLPDPHDERDKPLSALLGALAVSPPPPSASVRSPYVGPKDQDGTGSCSGQAMVQGARTTLLYRGVDCPPLSALFNYYVGRAEWGAERTDGGSHIRTAAKAGMRFGYAAERAWPFVASRVNKQPPVGAFRSGFDLRGVRGYYRIDDGDIDGVRRAIAAGHAVVGGWDVDRAFQDPKPRVIGAITGTIIGGHAMVLEDYAADGTFGLLNSWGTGWQSLGRARVTEAFVAQSRDVWCIDC